MPKLSPERKNELSRLLGRELEAVYARTPDEPLDVLLAAYGGIEARFLGELRDEPELSLETRRRVAELALYSSLEQEVPLPEATARLQAVSALGYGSLERRATVEIIFARYCLRTGSPDEAAALLLDLRTALQDHAGRGGDLYRHLSSTVESLLVDPEDDD
jgi:hypothetical protein